MNPYTNIQGAPDNEPTNGKSKSTRDTKNIERGDLFIFVCGNK